MKHQLLPMSLLLAVCIVLPAAQPGFVTVQTGTAGHFTFTITTAPACGYGYEIYNEGRLMIRQANIPAIAGKFCFTTKEDAKKVALLVIKKLKNGEMPPVISTEELHQLKIIP